MSFPNVTSGCITAPQLQINYVVLKPDSIFKTTFEGLCAQTLNIFGNYNDLVTGGPFTTVGSALTISRARNSANPYFTNLLMYNSQVKNAKGGMGWCSLEYRGLDPVYMIPPTPIYSLDRSTSNEPIQTHPKWSIASAGGSPGPIAGTPTNPVNGALFRSVQPNGSFAYNPNVSGMADTGFSANTAQFAGWISNSVINVGLGNSNITGGSFTGTDDYLLAGQTWTATYVSLSAPTSSDIAGVGFIATPLGSPPTPAGFSWIYLGCRYTDQAGVFRIDKSWRMFPTNGASQIIYTP